MKRCTVSAWVLRVATVGAFAVAAVPGASAQIVGENVNMVSGTQWPGGDPFLQRQNEPSVAISSVNAQHLLAGANDYRTVDLPFTDATKMSGDAWLGVFKSFDGGQTWQSVLLPGYPQDVSPAGMASPLHGFNAAGDPLVRAGTNGMLYYSGIVFNRGTNLGNVFVARFIDLNNKENGDATLSKDPIQYLDATAMDAGTSGQFLDKPWLATDIPRAGSGTCTIPTTPPQTFPAGNVYFVYATFTGNSASPSSKIMFTRSLDCGKTWSNPIKLSESNAINQGTTLAVDPESGAIHVVWRRFATTNQADAILYAQSTDFGRTFTKATVVRNIAYPFDQFRAPGRFRTEAFPTLAVSVDGTRKSRVHLAWSQRSAAGGDGQVVMTTSSDGGITWPEPVAVASAPIGDDSGNSFSRGHQFMPQLTFTQGLLMLLYYDSRLDHTAGQYTWNPDFTTGRFYDEARTWVGADASTTVFTPFIDDTGLTDRRHTIDVRVGQAAPGNSPSFTSVRVSNFLFGVQTDQPLLPYLEQLQFNPPNLPMFAKGTAAFIGDYIDIAGQAFVRKGGNWAFNTDPGAAATHYAVWTSNQDVRPPPDGDWTRYAPPSGVKSSAGGMSLFDPTQPQPRCADNFGYQGTRNQNIYGARISSGLAVSSPQNVKPLSKTLTRAFVVQATNTTSQERSFHFSLTPSSNVLASFQNPPATRTVSLAVVIPAHSSAHRAVFVLLGQAYAASSDGPASVFVTVNEDGGGLSGFLTLNPPGLVPDALAEPDSPAVVDSINSIEIYGSQFGDRAINNTNFTNTNFTNTNLTNTNLTNTNFTNTNFTNTNFTNTSVQAAHVSNAQVTNFTNTNFTNTNFTNTNFTNTNFTNTNLTNTNFTNTNFTNATISDANYVVTNTGNTTHSFHVKIVGETPTNPLQLILSKNYTTPISFSCQLVEEPHPVVLASIDDISSAVKPLTPGLDLGDPNIPDPSPTNATLSLAPGESAVITLRGQEADLKRLVSSLTPVVVPHAGGGDYSAGLLVASDGPSLGTPRVGLLYTGQLQAIGGTAPYTWALDPTSPPLPTWLTLSALGELVGTPTTAGTVTFTVRVTDNTSPAGTASRTISLKVLAGPTTTTVSALPSGASWASQPVVLTAAVSPMASGLPAPTGTVAFYDNGTLLASRPLLSGGTATLDAWAPTVGTHAITAVYAGDTNYVGSTSASLSQVVALGPTSVSLSFLPDSPRFGQTVTLTSIVKNTGWDNAPVPTGLVSFYDNDGSPIGTASLRAGTATLPVSNLTVGVHPLLAVYGGDANAATGTSSPVLLTVYKADTATTLASSLNPSYGGQAVTFTATVAVTAPGSGSVAGTVTFLDGATTLGSAPVQNGIATLTTSALAVGTHSITATYGGSGNLAGSTSQPVSQVVKTPFYGFTGFFSPLSTAGSLTSPSTSPPQKYGSAVPIKWQLTDASGAILSSLSTTTLIKAVQLASCSVPVTSTGKEVVLYSPTSGATGGSTFRFSTNQFVFNWDTSKGASKGCWEIVLQLNDGSAPRATIVSLQ